MEALTWNELCLMFLFLSDLGVEHGSMNSVDGKVTFRNLFEWRRCWVITVSFTKGRSSLP